jgi:RimJ/RimL family protein N-acetyltransferase
MVTPQPAPLVELRAVTPDDLPIFFEHQSDKQATELAAFPMQPLAPFMSHWDKIMADPTVGVRTVLCNGDVAGNIVSYGPPTERCVGYWLGRAFWGRGVASEALRRYLEIEAIRPLFAYVAVHNAGSQKVLAKCGFVIADGIAVSGGSGMDDGVDEVVMELR